MYFFQLKGFVVQKPVDCFKFRLSIVVMMGKALGLYEETGKVKLAYLTESVPRGFKDKLKTYPKFHFTNTLV